MDDRTQLNPGRQQAHTHPAAAELERSRPGSRLLLSSCRAVYAVGTKLGSFVSREELLHLQDLKAGNVQGGDPRGPSPEHTSCWGEMEGGTVEITKQAGLHLDSCPAV